MPLSSFDLTVISIGLSISLLLYYTGIHVPTGLRLPPGPPGHFLWRNLRDYPTGVLEYPIYEKWAKKYGGLVYLNVLGRSVLIVNSADMERELFNKKGAIYSGRPESTMMHDLTNFGKAAIFSMDYGERWSQHRALLHDVLSFKNLPSYTPIMEASARSFAQRLIAEPVNDFKFIRDVVGGFIMRIAYGIDVQSENDPFVKVAERLTNITTQAVIPGKFIVDSIPIMKYLPSWLPGLQFPKAAAELNKSFQDMLEIPFDHAKNAFNQGNSNPSFVSKYLEDLANNPNSHNIDEQVLREVAIDIYAAGIDTLDTQLRLFFLEMALFPDVQKKAQEELDRVVGRDNLPSFADLPSLPYVNALCSESFRWLPATPMGLPHKLSRDDVVNGYFIPKDTVCFGNARSLLRSENDYGADTNEFKPERFLKNGGAKLKPDALFGFGRRICPGKLLAETYFGIIVATVLQVANIAVLEDEPLLGIVENNEFAPGVISRPRDFRCRVEARPGIQNLLDQLCFNEIKT